ncbi:MAG: WYL domain-containing protein [Bauldia sp.]|nr:MAG: WYL domain-containing protein [Bauldia sp.]
MVTKTRRKSPDESSLDEGAHLRWSVEQRLAFVEERLFWIGAVNRNDLVRRFGVSMSQASADIGRYLARRPPGVAYDKSAKRYVAGENFRPTRATPNTGRLLGELRLVNVGTLAPEDAMLGMAPPFDATPVPERAVDPFVLRAVLWAVRHRGALDVAYQSMSRPGAARRIIEPHAFAHDGFRWHARAFDRETSKFRDFVLGRMTKPKRAGDARSVPEDDVDWRSFVRLRIAPHPGLTRGQSRAIAIDYGIRGGSTVMNVRRSLLFYALKRLGLDAASDIRPPREQHIVLLNRAEVEAALDRLGDT